MNHQTTLQLKAATPKTKIKGLKCKSSHAEKGPIYRKQFGQRMLM